MKPTRRPAPPIDLIAAPAGLAAYTFEIDGDEFAILEVPHRPASVPPGLTEAERAVVALLVQGLSNREIARARGTSERTVANQVAAVFARLGVGSRAELVARCAAGGSDSSK